MAISAATVAFMIGGDLIMKDGVQVAYTKIPLVEALILSGHKKMDVDPKEKNFNGNG